MSFKFVWKVLTYTSDFIDGLFNNIRSSGLDARRNDRASSGVKLCVASSFYINRNRSNRNSLQSSTYILLFELNTVMFGKLFSIIFISCPCCQTKNEMLNLLISKILSKSLTRNHIFS